MDWFSITDIPDFLSKHLLDPLIHTHIWQVSLQVSCGNTYNIWIDTQQVTNHCFDYSEILVN